MPEFLGIGESLAKWNLFTYCENEPVNNVDSEGLFGSPIQWICAVLGGIAGWMFGDFIARAIGLTPNGSSWKRVGYWAVRGLVVVGGCVLGYITGTKLLNLITKVVQSCMRYAENGSNQIHTRINGYKVTIRFYFEDGVLKSIDAFVGWESRIIGNLIKK